jgi:predicted DCC family thiol-disulfide oxidoreductase YuxK
MGTALQVAASADPAQPTFKVCYDGECEICQAGVSWIRILDTRRQCECIAISPEALEPFADRLDLDACLGELHAIPPDGALSVGAEAVARLAQNFRPTAWIGALAGVTPFRQMSRLGYHFIARNRYALSKCRGGACRVSKPDAVRKRAGLGTFWSCHTIGLAARLPLAATAAIRTFLDRIQLFARTRNCRLDLLDGKLSILFLGGFFPNAIPIVFGELFTMIFYDGLAIDPGSPKMRRCLARHLKEFSPQKIRAIVATHAHEEHVGNLNWLAQKAGAPVFVSRRTAEFLSPPKKLPWIRAFMIGRLRRSSRLLNCWATFSNLRAAAYKSSLPPATAMTTSLCMTPSRKFCWPAIHSWAPISQRPTRTWTAASGSTLWRAYPNSTSKSWSKVTATSTLSGRKSRIFRASSSANIRTPPSWKNWLT